MKSLLSLIQNIFKNQNSESLQRNQEPTHTLKKQKYTSQESELSHLKNLIRISIEALDYISNSNNYGAMVSKFNLLNEKLNYLSLFQNDLIYKKAIQQGLDQFKEFYSIKEPIPLFIKIISNPGLYSSKDNRLFQEFFFPNYIRAFKDSCEKELLKLASIKSKARREEGKFKLEAKIQDGIDYLKNFDNNKITYSKFIKEYLEKVAMI